MSRRSTADRWAVVTWHKEGLSVADIVHKTGFDRQFVNRWVKKFEAGEPIEEGKHTGRPRKRSSRVEQAIERTMRGKRRRSSRIVARDLKRRKIADISYKTVQRAAHNRDLHPFRRRKTSRLTESHKAQRLEFAKSTKKKDWSAVVFSDEHKFKQFKGGNPAHDIVWAKSVDEVPVKEVERWGLTLDAWAGISSKGKTELVTYEGTLDAKGYQDILEEALLPAAMELFEDEKDGWELQQDKASCHTAKSTMRFLEEKGIAVVEGWPTKGDDINPMENLWAILDERLQKKKFTTKQGMKKAVTAIWNDIDDELIHNLINSVPNRLRKIVKAQGGCIKNVHL
jgi:transposase